MRSRASGLGGDTVANERAECMQAASCSEIAVVAASHSPLLAGAPPKKGSSLQGGKQAGRQRSEGSATHARTQMPANLAMAWLPTQTAQLSTAQ